jgi:hypothetical protein
MPSSSSSRKEWLPPQQSFQLLLPSSSGLWTTTTRQEAGNSIYPVLMPTHLSGFSINLWEATVGQGWAGMAE